MAGLTPLRKFSYWITQMVLLRAWLGVAPTHLSIKPPKESASSVGLRVTMYNVMLSLHWHTKRFGYNGSLDGIIVQDPSRGGKAAASWCNNNLPGTRLASWCSTSSSGALLASWCSTNSSGALLASWCSNRSSGALRKIFLPSWRSTSSSGGSPNELYQLLRSSLGELILTSSSGEPSDELVLYQFVGRAFGRAVRRESLLTSWYYISSSGEPPGERVLHQLVRRAAWPTGMVTARQESSRRAVPAPSFLEGSWRAGPAPPPKEGSWRAGTAPALQESSGRAGTSISMRVANAVCYPNFSKPTPESASTKGARKGTTMPPELKSANKLPHLATV
ncbi:hypothetical protein PCANC_26451 [Puccinia coronata f. sp. avenae]|uniref:Endonuclease/exonuclease/phosphatase domain-containing protein n=1 Tax=Puccinia coronata f. sp. avenae TaxID=200324 RepID=A0A2N5UW77_9BASI|nr:hypothetical protein PCANC_26451 [Puccinia coronata f. sp. avenae]PLW41984.1 hypothetical protein PCASD_10098 [Puccinia coronata f. sp. avenae]